MNELSHKTKPRGSARLLPGQIDRLQTRMTLTCTLCTCVCFGSRYAHGWPALVCMCEWCVGECVCVCGGGGGGGGGGA